MDFRYLPMTETDKQQMLDTIGVSSTEELFADIPEKVRLKRPMQLKAPKNEGDLKKELEALARLNVTTKSHASFLGAGVYDHYIPSIVDHVISRSEFYTAYTPYQPEISQGELQAIFEFQTMICQLTGMDVANSSMYDGGTALAEAATLSAGHTRKKKILVSEAVHPASRQVIQSYAKGQHLQVITIPYTDGKTDLGQLSEELDAETAGVIIQYPNFLGQVEPLAKVKELIDEKTDAMFIVSSNPLALGFLTPPGEFGADIVVGDTQVFGIPSQFGGPHCGYFASTKKLMRKLPGRLVGQTKDENGKRGYVLTLQAREQHIRRDKATSNICSNQALNALASSVAMAALGKQGLSQMAKQNVQRTYYMKERLEKAGLEVVFQGAVFNELTVKLNRDAEALNKSLLDKGFIGGYHLGRTDERLTNHLLIAVTEQRSKQEIDAFVREVAEQHAN